MYNRTARSDVWPAENPRVDEVRAERRTGRRIAVVLVSLFVVVGVALLIYLMVFRLPALYRQQAARMIAPTIRSSQAGDVVYLGAYEQDNDTSNGDEPIEWIVLDKTDDSALLVSRYALDCIRFNTSETFVTWDRSTIRVWLNSTFYHNAFNGAERAMLIRSTQKTDVNPYFDTDGGEFTNDRIFLGNIALLAKYMATDESRMCEPTAYTIAHDAIVDPDTGCCTWWLRSPGFDTSTATRVLTDGKINYCGYRVHSDHQAVRPWMWVMLDPANETTEE